ncbi:MAG: HAMP domain-containing histidine kinase [Arcobacter sp.]|nr:HAMP domain-containing histidine kinase [Arcobacter sp.]
MNSKQKDFLISISIIYVLCIIVLLYTYNFLISFFGLNQDNFFFIVLPLVFLSLVLFLAFSKSLLKSLFKSDEELQKNIKETLHELNIPVSTIKMNTQLLQKNIKDEKALKRLTRINLASENLIKLYENMEYNIKRQIDRIEEVEFYLDDIVNKSLEKFEDLSKNIDIKVDIPKLRLKTDVNGFEKVIDNLISNAIKYNANKTPQIHIFFEDTSLSIFNKGEQINTKNLFIVFEKYFQENSLNKGCGIGLSIVKEFCDKNKIHISIDSLNDGNRFNLNLKEIIL